MNGYFKYVLSIGAGIVTLLMGGSVSEAYIASLSGYIIGFLEEATE